MSAVIGDRYPRLSSIPDGDDSRGQTAVDFARWCGLTLFEWQEDLLRDMCRIDDDGKWSARESVVSVSRQNGKGEVLVARELAGIYLFGEKTIYHTAHLMDTAIDAQARLWDVIESNDELMYWWGDDPDDLPTLFTSNGKEAITFPAVKAKVYFRTRTKKTARGLSVDLLIFDECYDLPREVYAAMNATTRARPNAHKIFISSPVNRDEHVHGRIFSAKRWAGIDGARGVLLKEWSPEPGADPFVPETWKAGNPSLTHGGVGAQYAEIEAEAEAARNSEELLDVFMVESLGVGNWYPRDGDDEDDHEPVVAAEVLAGAFSRSRVRLRDVVLAIDASADRSTVSVAAAGRTSSGLYALVGFHGRLKVDAVVAAVMQAVDDADPVAVIVDPKSPAEVAIEPIERKGIEVHRMTFPEVKSAANGLLQGLDDGRIKLADDERLRDAFDCVTLREDRDGGVAFARRSGTICQLVAVSFALWGVDRFGALPRTGTAAGRAAAPRVLKVKRERDFAF